MGPRRDGAFALVRRLSREGPGSMALLWVSMRQEDSGLIARRLTATSPHFLTRTPAAGPCECLRTCEPVQLPMPLTSVATPRLSIALGEGVSGRFEVGLPVLAGQTEEKLFGSARPAGQSGAITLFQTDRWLLGAATVPLTPGLEEASRLLYQDIFAAVGDRHLARVWNYVPAINETGPAELENYRVFCRGRSLAFEEHYGGGFQTLLPAASAVGTHAPALTIAFAACLADTRYVENPLQVPAYAYPPEHGPRSPSFSRATVVSQGDRSTVFVSGTAAIRGHVTIAPDHLAAQLECTLENLDGISAACRLGPSLKQVAGRARHFKVYLRHAADQVAVADALAQRLLTEADEVSYVQADLCRAELLVEIEASLFGVAPADSGG